MKSTEGKICIVIPFFYGPEQLRKCLAHLSENSIQDYNVILVDHRPSDSPAIENLLGNLPDKVTHIRGSDSLWWTGAINLGISKALESDCPHIMLLNHDCYLEKNALSALLECANSNPDALIAPVQVNWASKQTEVIRAYSCYLLGFPTLIPPKVFSNESKKIEVLETGMIVGGRGVLIPRSVFNRVGLLDAESLPHYGSDNDFYMACKRAGFRLLVNPVARAYIEHTQTTAANYRNNGGLKQFLDSLKNPKSHRNIKDQLALFRKHYPIPGLYPVGVMLNVFRYLLVYLAATIAGKLGFRSSSR